MSIKSLYPSFRERWQSHNGSIWLYSDPHFGDEELRRLLNRPSDEELIKRINSKVGKYDTFICLGDVGEQEWISQIHGYKVLVCGNHDAGAKNYMRFKESCGFDKDRYSLQEAMDHMKRNNWAISWSEDYSFRAPFEQWIITIDNQLFDEVYTGPLMIGEKLLLSHEPVDINWAFNIHGHDHNNGSTYGHLNVCADQIDYIPINLNSFIKSGRLKEVETLHRITIDTASHKSSK